MNLSRSKPGSNRYIMTLAIQLDGYKINDYNPDRMRYDHAGGVKYRSTNMVLEPAPGYTELFVKDYTINANRKDEDGIYVGLEILENEMASRKSRDNVQAEQRSPEDPPKKSSQGGTGGTYEP